jgi:hypothetical protein
VFSIGKNFFVEQFVLSWQARRFRSEKYLEHEIGVVASCRLFSAIARKTVDELLELKNGSGKTGITENLIPAPKQERPLKRLLLL